MRFLVVVGAVACLAASSARADEPCYPNPLRPSHVAAFAPAAPPDASPRLVEVPAIGATMEELALQRRCLRGEASVTPKAEFAPASPRTTVVAFPGRVVLLPSSPRGVELLAAAAAAGRVGDPQDSPSPAAPAPTGFTLGAVRFPAP